MGAAFGGRQEQYSNTRINRHMRKQGEFALDEARNLYNDDASLPSGYVGISDQRQGALDQMMRTSNSQNSAARVGGKEWQKTMSGAYLDPDSNPWMQEIVDRSVGGAMAGPQSGFSSGGRFGSGAMANAMADAGQNTAARLWGGNYQAERQNMMTAMGQTGQMQQLQHADATMQGKVGMEYEQDTRNQQAEEMRQFQYPYAKLDQFLSQMGANPLMGESSSDVAMVQPFQWGQALMGGIGGLFNPLSQMGGK